MKIIGQLIIDLDEKRNQKNDNVDVAQDCWLIIGRVSQSGASHAA